MTQSVNYAVVRASEEPVSKYIEDQNWFFLHWKFDPTIKSNLVVLDTVESYFCDETFLLYDMLIDEDFPSITDSMIELVVGRRIKLIYNFFE